VASAVISADHTISARKISFSKPDGSFVEVQIKARSRDVKFGDAALFAAMRHEGRKNYWFVFYSERMDKIWIMSSREFISVAVQNKTGNNVGVRSIWLNGKTPKRIPSM
jgi:hypothetical protein